MRLFTNDFYKVKFWSSLANTAILVIFVMVFQIGIALILALLVNNLRRGAQVFRIIFFMPIVISATAIGLLYYLFIQREGLFTQLFHPSAMGNGGYNWLPAKPKGTLVNWPSLSLIMYPVIWQYIGFYFVILLTGLTSISDDITEAAKIDGANAFQVMIRIQIPMLWNVFRTCMVLAITGALKVFDMPQTYAPSGLPGNQTFFMGTFNYYLYINKQYGSSAVYSILMILTGIVVSNISNLIFRENKDLL